MSAVIFAVPSADQAVVLDTRQALIYPFTVDGGWNELRLGVFISICQASDNTLTTLLTEDLPYASPADRVWMGFKTNNTSLPPSSTVFAGLSNSGTTEDSTQHSIVEAGDVASKWRYKGRTGIALLSKDGTNYTQNAGTIFGPEMAQNAGTTGGAGSLFILKLTKSALTFVQTVRTANYADADVWSNSCTIPLIRQYFRSKSYTTGLTLAAGGDDPDALYFYWPFTLSKLRIHALCLEQFA